MYDLGDIPTLSVVVRNIAGVAENAGAVTITITAPDGSVPVNAASVSGTAGVYTYSAYTPTMAGRYVVYWHPTGANSQDGFDDEFIVRERGGGRLVSLQDAKSHLNITSTDKDEEIREKLGAASSVIEMIAGPVALQTFVERVCCSSAIALNHRPVVAVTAIAGIRSGTPAIDLSDLDINKATGVVRRISYAGFYNLPYNVTYTAGYAGAIPHRFLEATLVQLAHVWETQRGASSAPRYGSSAEESAAEQPAIARRVFELLRDDLNSGFA